MRFLISLTIGYLLGAVNPAAILGKAKNLNLRELGSKNLGASNAMLTMGKGYGLLVMVLDIGKAYFSAKLARWMFPKLAIAGMVAALGAILGHIWPWYLHFKGGKGLAAFGGMVLYYKPWMFAALLALVAVLVVIVNYSYVAPMTAAVLFPILVILTGGDFLTVLIAIAASALIAWRHWGNIDRAKRGEEVKIRDIVTGKHPTD